MKRFVAVIAGLFVTASLASAQVTQVVSRNAVGYVRVNISSNYNLLNLNWVDVGTGDGVAVQELLDTSNLIQGNSVGGSDNLIIWDRVNQSQKTLYLYDSPSSPAWDGKWVEFGPVIATNVIQPGDGFYLIHRGPPTTAYMLGEVPADSNVVINMYPGYTFFGSSYSADMPINQQDWSGGFQGNSVGGADNIILFDGSTQSSKTLYLYDSPSSPAWDGKWVEFGPTISTNVIKVGEAVAYIRRPVTIFAWTNSRPYTWPRND